MSQEAEKAPSGSRSQAQSLGEDNDGSNSTKPYRYRSLAKPKLYHYQQTKWITKATRANWGTQDMLTTPSKAAMQASATPRVEALSAAKTNKVQNESRPEFLYSCGRDSPIALVQDGAKSASCSARVETLAIHKEPLPSFTEQHRDQYLHSCGRTSPICEVSDRAKTAGDRPRTTTLANYKPYHKDYSPEKQLPWIVSPATKTSACSERVASLSKPKPRVEKQFREPMWEVSASSRKGTASSRVVELSRFKPLYEGYGFNYDHGNGSEKLPLLIRGVPKNTKNAVTSTRINELSVPIVRQSMLLVQFNPDAFVIKPAALNAYCPPRIQELSAPRAR